MKTVRFVANILYGAALILAVGYGTTALYSFVVIIAKTPQFMLIENGRRFVIMYPFSSVGFLTGQNALAQIASMVSLLGCYGLFFYVLSEVFDIFRKERWFTEQGITRLQVFYRGNFTIPVAMYFLHIVFWEVETPAGMLVALHALLGVFTFFIAAIFEQGLHLQHEQDLII